MGTIIYIVGLVLAVMAVLAAVSAFAGHSLYKHLGDRGRTLNRDRVTRLNKFDGLRRTN